MDPLNTFIETTVVRGWNYQLLRVLFAAFWSLGRNETEVTKSKYVSILTDTHMMTQCLGIECYRENLKSAYCFCIKRIMEVCWDKRVYNNERKRLGWKQTHNILIWSHPNYTDVCIEYVWFPMLRHLLSQYYQQTSCDSSNVCPHVRRHRLQINRFKKEWPSQK